MASKEILCLNDHIAELDERQVEQALASLPEWRKEVALKYRHLQGRRESAVGYIELLRGLRLAYGIQEIPSFAYNQHGKPYLPDFPDIHFSISHCNVAAGCFISLQPCGLDVEHIRKAKPELVRYTMNPQEEEAIFASSCPDVAFTRLWTQKEAVVKLKGTGVAGNLHSILSPDELQKICLHTTENLYRDYIFTIAKQL